MNQLVSYAQGNSKATSDCHSGSRGCQAVFYFNPNHEYDSNNLSCINHPDADIVAAASESWFVHNAGYSDAAHRVHGLSASGCTIWEMNPNSSAMQNWWQQKLQNVADNYDLYFLDTDPMDVQDSGYFPSGGGCDPWPTICVTTQEIASNTAEVLARSSFVNGLSHSNGSPMHFFYQQASFNSVLDTSAFSATSRFVGVTCEGCISTYATPLRSNLYARVLNEMAAVNASPGAYLLISHGNSPAGSITQIQQRLITAGIIWLAYSEGHTVVQPDLESNTNNLAVWPEDLIYPSAPVQTMFASSNDLQVAPGIWRREFGTCYQAGRSFGRCAVVVNSTAGAVSVQSGWLSQTYGHLITLSGGDVLAGGTASVSGNGFVPSSTSVGAGQAILLAQ